MKTLLSIIAVFGMFAVAAAGISNIANSPNDASASGNSSDLIALDLDPSAAGANLNPVAEDFNAGDCGDDIDSDGDGWINDGCSIVDNGDTLLEVFDAESPANCSNNTDDDGDTVVNDGCTAQVGSLSTVQDCARINENNVTDADEDLVDAVNIDVVIDNIPAHNGMVAYNFKINYDDSSTGPQIANFGATGVQQLLVANADSSLLNTSDSAPDNLVNGEWNGGALDTGTTTPESGSGILQKIRIQSRATTATAVYPLTLANHIHVDFANQANFPDVTGNGSIAVNTACPLPPVDIELVSLSLTSLAPPTVPAGTPFQLRVTATAQSNGPNPADIQIDTSLPVVPSDCSISPPSGQSTPFLGVLPTETRVATHDWTVTCSDPSNHNFEATGSVSVTGLASESNASNNGPLTDTEVQVITDEADPKMTALSVSAPPTAATGAPFNVTVQATLHNNGPTLTPVTVDTVLDLAVPSGCTRVPDNPQPVNDTSLALSTPQNVQHTWVVTCTTPGLKTFDGSGSTALDMLHVTDSNTGNNSQTAQAQTDTSLGQADVKVSAVTTVAPPSSPVNTNFPVTVDTTVHNNGPVAPVNADVTLTLNLPPGCFTPVTTLVFQDASLGPSIAAQLPQVTFYVGCINHSFHSITATATIVIDDPLAGDPTPGNNTMTSAPSVVAVLRTADLKAVSATTNSPATASTGVPFNVTVDASVHNNGPDDAPASVEVKLNLPPDCSTPSNPLVVPVNLPVSSLTTLPTQTFPVTCTDRSFHDFDADVTVLAPLHVIDGTPGNDATSSGSSTTAVIAPADVKVASATVDAPNNASVNTPFNVNASAVLHNNGSFGPVNADASLALNLPPDCATADPNPVAFDDLSLPVSAPTPINAAWSVTCTLHSSHVFSSSASVVVDDLHVADPTSPNNSLSSGTDTTSVFANADGKATGATILSPPSSIPSNTNVNITVRKTLHNNGPLGPVTFNLSKSAAPVPGCTVTPPPTTPHVLAVSVPIQVDEVWTINCAAGQYSITFTNTLSVTGLHIADSNSANNSTSVTLTVVVDTDGDGIPDALEIACGSNPSSGSSIPERIDGVFAGVDDDGDTLIDEPLPAGALGFDCDRDGFVGSVENHVYQPGAQGDQDPCGPNSDPPTSPPTPASGWPADLFPGALSTNRIDVQDVSSYLVPIRYFNTDLGTNTGDVRWDLLPGAGVLVDDINVQDISVIALLNNVPMLGGARAFNGPACPYPP